MSETPEQKIRNLRIERIGMALGTLFIGGLLAVICAPFYFLAKFIHGLV